MPSTSGAFSSGNWESKVKQPNIVHSPDALEHYEESSEPSRSWLLIIDKLLLVKARDLLRCCLAEAINGVSPPHDRISGAEKEDHFTHDKASCPLFAVCSSSRVFRRRTKQRRTIFHRQQRCADCRQAQNRKTRCPRVHHQKPPHRERRHPARSPRCVWDVRASECR